MNMSRWTKAQKEMQGYRRKLAYGREVVSLKVAPWEDDNESTRNSESGTDQHVDQENAERIGRY
jgi:hypothetical protein